MNTNDIRALFGVSPPVEANTPPVRPALAPNYSRPVLPPRYPPMQAYLQLDLAQQWARANGINHGDTFTHTLTCSVEPGPLLTNIVNEIRYYAPAYGLRVTNANELEVSFERIPFYPRYIR